MTVWFLQNYINNLPWIYKGLSAVQNGGFVAKLSSECLSREQLAFNENNG